jgi:voltage-gated potassium channel
MYCSLPIASFRPCRYQQRPCNSDCLPPGRGDACVPQAGFARHAGQTKNIGRVLCKLIKEETEDIVVIDENEALVPALEKDKMQYFHGDAADENVLLKAGIDKAAFLVAALGTDTANVFLVLTARQLNPDIFIMARASSPNVRKKLMVAGANMVESPYDTGAVSMGLKLLRPSVSNFLDVALSKKRDGIQIDEIFVPHRSKYTHVALKNSGIRQDFNLIIISIKKASGEMLFNPHFETLIEPQDTVIVMGKEQDLKLFSNAIQDNRKENQTQ